LTACAPTARGAFWLARAGREQAPASLEELRQALGGLPVSASDWADDVCHRLGKMGVGSLGECMRLPRDGFARRFGQPLLDELDRALGRLPEPGKLYQSPPRFSEVLELPAETLNSVFLCHASERVLCRLGLFLRHHQMGLQSMTLHLQHHGAPDTVVAFGFREPQSDVRYLGTLIGLRLDRLKLVAPVTALSLTAESLDECGYQTESLPGYEESVAATGVSRLVGCLCARLGPGNVYGMALVADHRPEHAWSIRRLEQHKHGGNAWCADRERPLWLLEQPLPLDALFGEAGCSISLDPESNPERIETGWWDGGDVRRDYYIARNSAGARCWIFRDQRAATWYLHGMFG